MRSRAKYLCVAAGLLLGAHARAEQWFAVTQPGDAGAVLEVDLDTVHLRGYGGDGVIRVTLDVLHAHATGFGYRSFVANVQFDCQRRNIILTSAAYFPLPFGQGQRVGADSSGKAAGMPPGLLDRIPQTAQQALLKAACTPTRTSSAA
jgi:hypothetical protein